MDILRFNPKVILFYYFFSLHGCAGTQLAAALQLCHFMVRQLWLSWDYTQSLMPSCLFVISVWELRVIVICFTIPALIHTVSSGGSAFCDSITLNWSGLWFSGVWSIHIMVRLYKKVPLVNITRVYLQKIINATFFKKNSLLPCIILHI